MVRNSQMNLDSLGTRKQESNSTMNKTTGYRFNTGRDPSPSPQYGNLVRASGIRYNPDLQKEVPLRVPLDMEYAKETRKQANILFK